MSLPFTLNLAFPAAVAQLCVRHESAMLPVSEFFAYWGLAFLTLCASLLLTSIFFSVIDTSIGLHSWAREARIAVVASLVQGAGFWFAASLVPGGIRRLVIPSIIVAIIYWLTHLDDWSGYETGAILFFQMVIWTAGGFLLAGEVRVAVILIGAAAVFCAFIASVAKSL